MGERDPSDDKMAWISSMGARIRIWIVALPVGTTELLEAA